MKTPRIRRIIVALTCIAFLGMVGLLIRKTTHATPLPSLSAAERTLLRIWILDAPGGGQSWLKQQLRQYEKQHPGVSTYLRTVSAQELIDPDVILPDIVLYMPGQITQPEALFMPLSGSTVARDGLLRAELLRCGRWQGNQYGLPLCWGGWVLAIDSALEPEQAVTPAPTTLLGKPAMTAASATQEPG